MDQIRMSLVLLLKFNPLNFRKCPLWIWQCCMIAMVNQRDTSLMIERNHWSSRLYELFESLLGKSISYLITNLLLGGWAPAQHQTQATHVWSRDSTAGWNFLHFQIFSMSSNAMTGIRSQWRWHKTLKNWLGGHRPCGCPSITTSHQ